MSQALIQDQDQLVETLQLLYTAGYSPYLVRPDEPKGKVWETTYQKNGDLEWSPTKIVPLPLLLAAASEKPGYGISIAAAHTQAGIIPVVLDVDCVDDDVMDDVRRLLPPGMPGWRGRNAGTLIGRSAIPYNFRTLVQPTDKKDRLASPAKLKFAGPLGMRKTAKGEPASIDLLSAKSMAHALLPPTLHREASFAAGRPVYYEWLEGCPKLWEVKPGDLPVIQPWHMLSIHQLAKNSVSAFMRFVREWGPGNFHDLMVGATYYLLKEGWEQDHVIACMNFHIEKQPDEKTAERRQAVQVAVIKARAEAKEPDPAPAKGGLRYSPDAEMLIWLEENYPLDSLAVINGTLCHWKDNRWHDLRGPYPDAHDDVTYLSGLVHNQFNHHRIEYSRAAAKEFMRRYTMRAQHLEAREVVPFDNGVYDPRTNEFRPEEREDGVVVRLPYPYIEAPECPIYDSFLLRLLTPSAGDGVTEDCAQVAVQMMNEWYGHALLPRPRFQKALFVIGPGGVGKSELDKLAARLFPKFWYSNVPAAALHDANAIRHFDTVRLNSSSEMRGLGGRQTPNFLAITGGDAVDMKTLFQDRAAKRPVARLMFFGNLMEQLDDISGDIMRRLIILRTTDEKPEVDIPNLHLQMLPEAPHILSKWAQALGPLLARAKFQPPAYTEKTVQEAIDGGGAFNLWLAEEVEPLDKDEPNNKGTPITVLYASYVETCEAAGFKHPMTRPTFKSRLAAKGFVEQSISRVGGRNGKAMRPYRLRLINDTLSHLPTKGDY